MEEISNYVIIPMIVIALVVIYFVAPLAGIEAKLHRFAAIDGLRGYLATFVFLHHAATWYYFVHIEEWSHEPSGLFLHFGSTSVALFFMITSFLFFSKLIDAYSARMDWLKLYVSRLLRIMPLYVFAVAILFLMVALLSHFVLRQPIQYLLAQAGQWLFFMEPDVNGIEGTKFIISGVQWTLAFEWAFYCSLPLFGWLFFKIKTPLGAILIASLFLTVFLFVIFHTYPIRAWYGLAQFAGGIPAAFLQRNAKVRKYCSQDWFSIVLCVLLFAVLYNYSSIFTPLPYLCVTVVFAGIACGNDLFGLLTFRASRLLGQVSYSIYLLHGLLLFLLFKFALGIPMARKLSPLGHWVVIGVFCAALMVITSLTYYWIERPCINSTGLITDKIRGRFKKKSPTVAGTVGANVS